MTTTILPALAGYDWEEAFGYAGEPDKCATAYQNGVDVQACLGLDVSPAPFTRADVVEVAGIAEGQNDEQSWIVFGRLADDRWFMLDAWCDYTGWDCRAGGWAKVADSREAIIALGMTKEHRARFGLPEAA